MTTAESWYFEFLVQLREQILDSTKSFLCYAEGMTNAIFVKRQ